MCRFRVLQRANGDGDAALDERANLLGLGQRGDDAAFRLGLVVLVSRIALGEEQRTGEIAEQRPLMTG